MKKAYYTEEKIIGTIKEHETGAKVGDLYRKWDALCNWRSKCVGLEVNETKRLREIEKENNKLKKFLADKRLGAEAMRDMLLKKG
ncbi:transposase [Vreelandella populi]|nr:transposase [Halomonas populi]